MNLALSETLETGFVVWRPIYVHIEMFCVIAAEGCNILNLKPTKKDAVCLQKLSPVLAVSFIKISSFHTFSLVFFESVTFFIHECPILTYMLLFCCIKEAPSLS